MNLKSFKKKRYKNYIIMFKKGKLSLELPIRINPDTESIKNGMEDQGIIDELKIKIIKSDKKLQEMEKELEF